MFDNMIADIEVNKKLIAIVTELFLSGRKLNILLVFIWQSHLEVRKAIRINATHYFIIKIPKKRDLKHIAWSHSSDTGFKDFMKVYKDCAKEPYSILVNDTTLLSDIPLTVFRIGGAKRPPYQFFPCNFYKHTIWSPKLSDF